MSADRIILNQAVQDLDASPEYPKITGVKIITGEDSNGDPVFVTAGKSNGYVLEFKNPWANKAVAKNILAAIAGYAYRPYKAKDAILNPVAEVGDAVTVGNVYSVIADIETKFNPLMPADISAPNGSDIDHEYSYKSAEQRAMEKLLADSLSSLTTSFIVENGKISGRIEEVTRDVDNIDAVLNGTDKVKGLVTKVSEVTQTVEGLNILSSETVTGMISDSLNQAIGYDSNGKAYGTLTKWAKANITTDSIFTLVQKKFDLSGAAETAKQAAITAAQKYTDKREAIITSDYESQIKQSATDITSTVASAVSKYDTSKAALQEVTGDQNVTLSYWGYGKPGSSPNNLKASEHNGEYYLSQSSGYVYVSNGSTWTRFDTKLPTLTSTLKSEISQSSSNIKLWVQSNYNNKKQEKAQIDLSLESITMSVTSSGTKGTTFKLTSGKTTLTTAEVDLQVDAVNITGQLTANQINANGLKVSAANITGTLTASQIDATNLHVSSANIDGAIQATSVAAYATIQSPSITGGTISGSKYTSPYGGGSLNMIDNGNTDGTLWFGPASTSAPSVYNAVFSVRRYLFQNSYYASIGINGSEYIQCKAGSARLALSGTWDFSNATVIGI